MYTNIGIWIDHKEAMLVSLEGSTPHLKRIKSDAERHFRVSGGWKSGSITGGQSIFKEQKAEQRRKHQYRKYYKKIIRHLAKSERILLLGPGEAKQELAKEISKLKSIRPEISAIEPCEKITDKQLTAKVKSFFELERVR